MRLLYYFYLTIFIYFIFNIVIGLLIRGELFNPGALRNKIRETWRTVWLGMKLFVVFWILYLLLNWWLRTRR